MDRLKEKVAIITGGTAGIEYGIAECFIKEGATVIITGRNQGRGQTAAKKLGPQAIFMPQDVSKESDWQRVIKDTIDQFDHLNILVNNAGIAPKYESIDKLALADWQRVINVDLTGTFLGIKYGMAEMIRRKCAGSIINIASIASFIGGAKSSSYGAAKGGVRLLTKCAAIDGANHKTAIRVNSVHPGPIRTAILTDEQTATFGKQTPLGHIGKPTDIGNICVYLGSDESEFTTGASFIVDGGWTAL